MTLILIVFLLFVGLMLLYIVRLILGRWCCPTRPHRMLYSISISHYNEMARWALQAGGHRFDETTYMPGAHIIAGPMKRLRRFQSLSCTGKDTNTPVYVGVNGEVYGDSWEILELGLGKVDERLKKLLDEKLGPAARALAYNQVTSDDMNVIFADLANRCPVPLWQRSLWRCSCFRNKIAQVIRQWFCSDIAQSEHDLNDALREIEDSWIAKGEFKEQAGGKPSAAAVALATLLAPVLSPEQYTAGFMRPPPQLEEWPEAFKEKVIEWRKTKAGKLALNTYRDYRTYSSSSNSSTALLPGHGVAELVA